MIYYINSYLFFGLLLAHIISDFILQTHRMTKKKYSREKKDFIVANIIHALVHSLFATTISAFYYSGIWFLVAGIFVFISHLIIDLIKASIIRKYPRHINNIILFIGDQTVHIIAIFLISWFVDVSATGWSEFVHWLSQLLIDGYFDWQFIISGNRIVLLVIMLLLGIPVAASFIRIFMGWLKYRPVNKEPSKDIEDTRAKVNDKQGRGDRGSRVFDGGLIIGILERTIIIFSIAVHMEAIVGFLIAVKSIARFKKFEDDVFVEYFIIGSFLSLLIAVVIGFLIREAGLLSTL